MGRDPASARRAGQRSLHRSAAGNTHTTPTSCVRSAHHPRLGSTDVRGLGRPSARSATAEPGPSNWAAADVVVRSAIASPHTWGLSRLMHSRSAQPARRARARRHTQDSRAHTRRATRALSRRGAIQHRRGSRVHRVTTQHGSIAPRHGHQRRAIRSRPARTELADSRSVLPVCAPDTSAVHNRIENSQP